MIRLGTIGTSRICDSFIGGAKLSGEFELSAVYSRKYETGKAFADKNGCGVVFTDLYEMAEYDGIDAVYIASPNVFHAEQSRIFLEKGKHVICEKPIVTRVTDYEKNKALADKNGLIYMEAIIPMHIPKYGEVKNARSKLGSITRSRIDYSQRSSRLDSFNRGEQVNIFDMSLHAGALMDLGIYCVYGAVDLLGVPNTVSAEAQLLYNGADGSGRITFGYDSFTAELTYSKIADGDLGSEIVGEGGALRIDMISQYAGVKLIIDGEETKITGHDTIHEQMRGEAQRFADYILRYEENKADYERISELCHSVHETMERVKSAAGLVYPNDKIN